MSMFACSVSVGMCCVLEVMAPWVFEVRVFEFVMFLSAL